MRLLPLALLLACSQGDPGLSADTDTTAPGVGLQHVEFFQVVSVPTLWDGVEVAERNAPLVADRASVLRATIDVQAGWEAEEAELVVVVSHDGASDTYTTSTSLAAAQTLRVELPAEAVDEDATYVVELSVAGSPVDRFPASGEAPVDAEVTGPIKIHLVPFELNGFVPDTSQAVVDGYRDAVFAVYPASEVQITVGAVVPASSDNLGDLLVDVGIQQEQIDQSDADLYYYGMATGVATREEFDGITGSSQEIDTRAGFAIGAAFGDQKAEDTLIHELGHLHYLVHADCGGAGAEDPDFPYLDAGIGVEGYDVRTDSFISATEAYDMMAYCYPRWISDYHYGRLADWVQQAQGW